MVLRLYREPYFDPGNNGGSGRMRLLFEVDAVQNAVPGERLPDFYLYVWVRSCAAISAFQAVLENETVLNFNDDGQLVCGKISTGPINRMVLPQNNDVAMSRISDVIRNIECPVFGKMIETVKSCLDPDAPPALNLVPAEAKLCRALAHGWKHK